MAKPWNYIPTDVLDDENLENQARQWANEQAAKIAADWRRAQTPDPLARLRAQNEYLYPDQGASQYASPAPPDPFPQPQPQPRLSNPALPDLRGLNTGAASTGSTGTGTSINDISQFGHQTISQADAYAICGPAAAVRLASFYGNQIPINEALMAAKRNGWTQDGGMNGIGNQKKLLDDLGVPTRMDTSGDTNAIIADAVTGNPVTVSTPRHYFTISGYDPQSGKLFVGKSGTDLKGGSDWLSIEEIRKLGGGINGALFVDNPSTPMTSPGVKMAAAKGDDNSLQGLARKAARQIGIPEDIFVAQIQQESSFDPNAVSPAGARGIAQFMPGTAQGVAKQLGVTIDQFWKDPGLQLQGAATHMKDLLARYGGDMKLALAAYNAGPGNVDQFGGVPPFKETQHYIEKILGSVGEQISKIPGDIGTASLNESTMRRATTQATGQFLSGANEEAQRQQMQLPGASSLPGLGPDPSAASSAGFQRAGVPGAKETGQYLGPIPVGPAEVAGLAVGALTPMGPAGKASKVARTAGEVAAEGVQQQARRFFHGTSGDFLKPEGWKFDPRGLFGPGYYLTDDARVAGGVVDRADDATLANIRNNIEVHTRELAKKMEPAWQPEHNSRYPATPEGLARQKADWIKYEEDEIARLKAQLEEHESTGAVLEAGYAQKRINTTKLRTLQDDLLRHQRAASGLETPEARAIAQKNIEDIQRQINEAYASGPNVRAVDVPNNFNLLDADKQAPSDLVDAAVEADIFPFERRLWDRTGKDLWDALRDEFGPEDATDWLNANGYDGIKYAGGSRVPMRDQAGKPIEHEALVVFENSLDKLRNAISGTMGGQAEAQLAIRGGSAAAGAVAGYESAPEEAEWQEKFGRAAVGAGVAFGLGHHFLSQGRRQRGQLTLGPGGGGGPLAPRGGGGSPPPRPPALGGPPSPGGPGPGNLRDTMGMWARNRRVRDPGFLTRAKESIADFPREFEHQIADRYVDLNRLGHNVEVAVSTYLGRLPGMEQRAKDEFVPLLRTLGEGRATNGFSMLDNFNSFVKFQRDLEVANAKGTAGGLRQASARGTGAAHARSLLNELQGSLQPGEWNRILKADLVRQEALDRLMDDRVQSGLISNELRTWLLHNYPHYNPTIAMKNIDQWEGVTVGGGRKISQNWNNLHRLMRDGIASDTEEPFLSAIGATMRGDLDIRRNGTVRTIVEALEASGDLLNKRIDNRGGDQVGVLKWYENGKRWAADVPKEVDRAAKALDDSSLNWFLHLGQRLNTPLRLGAVVLSPSFVVLNATADLITTFIRQGGGAAARVPGKHASALAGVLGHYGIPTVPHLRPGSKIPVGLKRGTLVQDTESYRKFVRGGGGMSTLSTAGQHADVEELIKQAGGTLIRTHADWKSFAKDMLTLKPLRMYGEAVEMSPRLATFEQELARGSTLGEAVMAGRRVTIDFARAGHAIKMANSWTLFLNARVQGTLNMGRTLRDKPNSRWRLASVAALAASTYAWNQKYQEEWEDIPEWEKRSHAIIILGPGEKDPEDPTGKSFKSVPRVSIPLREWALFVNPLIGVFNEIKKDNPEAWQDFVREGAEGFAKAVPGSLAASSPVGMESPEAMVGGPIPAPLRTMLEIPANKKFFSGSPIESARMEGLPASERFNERSTLPAQAMSALSRGISERTGAPALSPIQMDFIIQENLGGFGRQISGDRPNPFQSVARTYAGQGETNRYKSLDIDLNKAMEDVAELVRQQPGYETATRDRQLQMQRQAQNELLETLRDKYGIEPKERDLGLPGKYRGVNDPKQEQKIDEAIRKYEAWLSDRKTAPRPTPEEQRLARRYGMDVMRNRAYTKETKARSSQRELLRAGVRGLVPSQ